MAQVVDQWHSSRRGPDGQSVRSAKHGRGKRWAVRYRDPGGGQRTEAFDRKADADRRAAAVATSMHRGAWVDPVLARTNTGEWLRSWLVTNAGRWRPSTVRKRRQLIEGWFVPAFGSVPLSQLRPSVVQAAVSGWQATHAAGSVAHAVSILRQALAAAVEDGLMASNPAARVRRDPAPRRRDVHLSDQDVAGLLGAAMTPAEAALMSVLAFGGLRLGEVLGLTLADVDYLDQRGVQVSRQVDTSTPERAYLDLKTAASRRLVPLPAGTLALLGGLEPARGGGPAPEPTAVPAAGRAAGHPQQHLHAERAARRGHRGRVLPAQPAALLRRLLGVTGCAAATGGPVDAVTPHR